MNHVAVTAHRQGIRGVADRALVHVDELRVDPQPALFHEVPVLAEPHLGRVAVVAEDLRSTDVKLQNLWNRHRRRLQLVPVIGDVGNRGGVQSDVVVQPSPVVLGLDRHAAVLDPRVEARHPVIDLVHRDAGSEEIGRKDDAAIGQTDLAVLDSFGARLRLLVLDAVRVVHADPRCDLVVGLVVAEPVPRAKLAGGRQPLD